MAGAALIGAYVHIFKHATFEPQIGQSWHKTDMNGPDNLAVPLCDDQAMVGISVYLIKRLTIARIVQCGQVERWCFCAAGIASVT